MLRQITIQNIALIRELTVHFGAGFSALTGETGAGKSILVDSMNLALGERADRELVRTGTDRARVAAVFEVSGEPRVLEAIQEMGLSAQDGQIVITRELSSSGRSSVKINGAAQPLTALKRLTALMVDLHGQHEHQSLLDEEKHLSILDAFAGDDLQPLLADVRQRHAAYAKARRELRAFSGDARERAHRVDMLAFQIQEIEQARLRPGEEEALRAERDKLRNAEKITTAILSAKTLLSGGERSKGAVAALTRAASLMRSIDAYDEGYGELAARIEEAAYSMEDVALEIGGLTDEEDIDPRRIDHIEERLELIKRLGRKYGDDIQSILAFCERAREDMEKLTHAEEYAKKLDEELSGLREDLIAACEKLSAARYQAAKAYSAAALEQASDLGMAGARFEIEVEPPEEGFEEERLTPEGFDRVRFLFSANAGEPMKPLARIASGGEMSRVMLALKSVTAGEIGTLIFDEIDTGISGRMAQAVGEKIARIAKGRQVICVTHLHQIACMADEQYVVYKTEEEGRAGTRVERLDEKGRITEIARLVGGAGGEEAARQHAAGMLKAAGLRKKEL